MSYQHSAVFYAGLDGFLAEAVPFLRDGARQGDAALVVVDPAKIAALRSALGKDAGAVEFADMRTVGANPARIIPAWQQFLDANRGRRLRGIGEPIWAGRSGAELVECQVHERLLNVAVHPGTDFQLVCPYDTAALPAEVVAEARLCHEGLHVVPEPVPLPEPPAGTAPALAFDQATLAFLRKLVHQRALEAGVRRPRASELVLAVNEVATNSLQHGGGEGRLRLWADGAAFVCEVADHGRIADPLADRRRPSPHAGDPRGLWLANQLCDLVQVRSSDLGTVVRLHVATG